MKFSAAKRIAECWVEVSTDGQAVLHLEKIQSLPYGWVFFYNSPEFIADSSNLEASLVGNVPFLIERTNGELRVLGARYKERLQEIEKELPAACLGMSPEMVRW